MGAVGIIAVSASAVNLLERNRVNIQMNIPERYLFCGGVQYLFSGHLL
jgi:hypothetical protein